MHECWFCGQACDCDGEDTWFEEVDDCEHECYVPEDDNDDYGFDPYADDSPRLFEEGEDDSLDD